MNCRVCRAAFLRSGFSSSSKGAAVPLLGLPDVTAAEEGGWDRGAGEMLGSGTRPALTPTPGRSHL